MELSSDYLQIIQDVVLRPTLASALGLFVVSFVNELFAVLPYSVILSGQLFFLHDSISVNLVTKIFFFVAVPVGFGAALGSVPTYVLAYYGGKPAIEKFGKYLGFSWPGVEKVKLKFKGGWYDEILFLALRSVPLLPYLPISAAAGILQMPAAPYLALTVVGAIIRIMIMFMFVGVGIETLAR